MSDRNVERAGKLETGAAERRGRDAIVGGMRLEARRQRHYHHLLQRREAAA